MKTDFFKTTLKAKALIDSWCWKKIDNWRKSRNERCDFTKKIGGKKLAVHYSAFWRKNKKRTKILRAVNKLVEIVQIKHNLTRKDKNTESKASSAELKKREKENRKLQLELNTEKEKFNQMVSKTQKDLQDLQVILSLFVF